MEQKFIDRLLSDAGTPPKFQKPFRFGRGTLAINQYIMAISGTTPLNDLGYGDPRDLEPIKRILQNLPEKQIQTIFDINLLRQAIEILESQVVRMNLYQRTDGAHYIELIDRCGKAVLLCGMSERGDNSKEFPTIKKRFEDIDPTAFSDYGAWI